MNSEIIKLKSAKDLNLVGGKAKSLATLMVGGFNVADGFVITTAAMLSPDLEVKILENFDQLNSLLVAVRSSAVGEDGKHSSFAGQFDTFLNVSRQELLDKVKLCLESANSTRAAAYSSDMDTEAGRLAVIVQAMVKPSYSGVAFSANPITGSRNEVIIEATRGLGDKLVSGQITPDTYVIKKDEISFSKPHSLLSSTQILELRDIIKNVENLFGFPVDVEWVLADGKYYTLQSRPITTL